MENASKALIMAGSVLIALMIIGALLLMFNNLTSYQDTDIQGTREAQIVAFNNQYTTYDRNNVRGSDIYSLLNKVIDYNRRKSTEGTGNDQGQYVQYEPMSITIKMDKTKLAAPDGKNILFTENEYTVNKNKNKFEEDITREVRDIETKYGKDSLAKLTTGLTKIFIDSTSSETKKKEAIINYYNAVGQTNTLNWDDDWTTKWNPEWNKIKEESATRKDVYKYYELVQFKRAYFNCISTTYNEKTGRITSMTFEFNGKFQ